MKEGSKRNLKQAIETLLIGIICSAFVISMNQSCSNSMNKWTNNKKSEVKNVKDVKYKKTMMFNTFIQDKVR